MNVTFLQNTEYEIVIIIMLDKFLRLNCKLKGRIFVDPGSAQLYELVLCFV